MRHARSNTARSSLSRLSPLDAARQLAIVRDIATNGFGLGHKKVEINHNIYIHALPSMQGRGGEDVVTSEVTNHRNGSRSNGARPY